jgi:hypothetical protein
MSDQHPHGPRSGGGAEGVDREIHVKTFFWFSVGFVGLTAVSLLAMWILFGVLERQAHRRDPAPSPLAEANQRRLPPGPNLQTVPEKDLAAMRAAEEARLHGYGWVDESQGIAHIPIERAIEILAQRGATATIEVAPAPGTQPAAPEAAPTTAPPAAEEPQ